MNSLRRVVVTGLGLVTPLATGVQKTWQELINGNCGIISLVPHEGTEKKEDTTILPVYSGFEGLPSTVAGVVKRGKAKEGGFDPEEWLDRGDERKMALFTQFAIASAKQALADAQWAADTDYGKERTGVCIGSGVGSLEDVVSTTLIFERQGYRKISPFFVPRMLINMAAGHLTMKYGFRGPNHAVATACTTGAHAIGDASRFIQFGDADVMVAGGSESCIHPLSIAGFAKAKSLVTKMNDRPKESSRPFDREREGFVMGEGAGILVLEELEHAKKRGARIYAELCGYGLSGDAHHMTAPPEDGSGAALAMKRALHHAKSENEIDYINAHATSTILGDIAENRAIANVFPNRVIDKGNMSNVLAVSSTKGAIGHLLGAAGAVEAIFTVLAVYENIIPPTLNLQKPDTEFRQFNYVPLTAQQKVVRAALTNSFGFGGVNASLCFRKFEG
ncbi:10786_t:CDS:2 [Ambispora gerdemannii]|uniref:3-oxoacyl-[acyl-carrier-protein] synthase n=1 Tax=Ambispora gerdemannii TaxID=144530 RepID=A0A9N8WJE2_9GLOM|nr:10786_t:CDS:2 [Ambispora gerdemannii]